METNDFCIKTDSRTVDVSQCLLYVVEVSDELAAATGVDLVSASAAAIDSAGVVAMVKELGLSGRAYIKNVNGKAYLILKGAPGQRAVLKGTRYLASNPKVSHIAISSKALARSAAKMNILAVVAYAGLRVVEALLKDGEDVNLVALLGTIASDVIKFSISAAAGFLAGAAIGAITTVAAGPMIAAVLVGLAAGIVLDRLDRHFGLTEKLIKALEAAADTAMGPIERLAQEIHRWEQHMINRAIGQSMRYR